MDSLASLRDLSLILLALEAFVLCLPVLIAGVFIVRGLGQLRRWLVVHFPLWQQQMRLVRDTVEKYAARAVTPVMVVTATGAAVLTALRLILPAPGTYRGGRNVWQ